MSTDVVVPDISGGLTAEALGTITLAEWLAGNGKKVRAGSVIAVVDTDVAAFEVLAPHDGWLEQELALDVEVTIGQTIGKVHQRDPHLGVKLLMGGMVSGMAAMLYLAGKASMKR